MTVEAENHQTTGSAVHFVDMPAASCNLINIPLTMKKLLGNENVPVKNKKIGRRDPFDSSQ